MLASPEMLSQPPTSRMRAVLRVFGILLGLAVAFPVSLVLWLLKLDRARARVVQAYFRFFAWVVGIRFRVSGTLAKARPLMLVSNHAGYLDVFIMGSMAPVSFTPKREVRSWPVVGFLCVLADCVFVERKPAHMEEASRKMRKRLSRDKILCLFPEGTTSDNTGVKPFKSGFFSLAEADEGEEALPVQPVTLLFTHIGNAPMQPHWRERVAWVGDDTFFDHFWRVLKLPSVTANIHYHPVQILPPGGSRKELSQTCEQMIATKLREMIAEAA